MSKSIDNKETQHGKSWNTHSSHKDFFSAVTDKNNLQKDKTLEVKIRRRSDDTFHVKMRSLKPPAPEEKTSTNKPDAKPKNRSARRDSKKKRALEKKE